MWIAIGMIKIINMIIREYKVDYLVIQPNTDLSAQSLLSSWNFMKTIKITKHANLNKM